MKQYIQIATIAVAFLALGMSADTTRAIETYTFNYDMKVGAANSDVVALQNWLMTNGYDIPVLRDANIPKGYFGAQTRLAVIKFQIASQLPATGFVGPLTRSRLNQKQITTSFSIKVSSPNGGENWESGSVHRISWNLVNMIPASDTANEAQVDLYLRPAIENPCQYKPGLVCTASVMRPDYILDTKIKASTKYDWIVGTDEKNNTIPAGRYFVRACISSSSTICDASDTPFTITPTTSEQASVTTVAPNGGENWQNESVQTIEWKFSKTPTTNTKNYTVDISIANEQQISVCPAGYSCMPPQFTAISEIIAKNIPGEQQKYIWTVGNTQSGNTIPTGNYKISICFSGTTNCAVSDAAFTVSNQTPTQSPLTLSVTTTGRIFKQTDSIPIHFQAYNSNGTEMVFQFNSGCQTKYTIDNLFDSAANMMCTANMSSLRIPAYGTKSWDMVHTPERYKIPIGEHTLTVSSFIGNTKTANTASVQITIVQ